MSNPLVAARKCKFILAKNEAKIFFASNGNGKKERGGVIANFLNFFRISLKVLPWDRPCPFRQAANNLRDVGLRYWFSCTSFLLQVVKLYLTSVSAEPENILFKLYFER